MFKAIGTILAIPDLRQRIFFTLIALAIYRIGFFIYLPGVDVNLINSMTESQNESSGLLSFISMTSLLTGGALSQATIFSLGIMPYISASIIFSLMTKVFPKLEELQKEGESGRKVIARWTRYSAVGLCLIQSMFVVFWVSSPASGGGQALSAGGFGTGLLQVLVLTAGTLFLMWLGEKITENGIGNGISLIIMAGIVAIIPASINDFSAQWQSMDVDGRPFFILKLVSLLVLFFVVTAGVVFITKGQRRIPIQNARTVRGTGSQRHYMPIKVNSAGVLPIIFAQSLLIIPGVILNYFEGTQGVADLLAAGSFWYYVIYTLMIGFFTYFWTSLYYNPVEMSENMKEYGSFIPGIRPGRRTAEYLQQVFSRITLAGAVFLAVIALIPQIITDSLNVNFFISGMLGGTGLLIVVGVALDLVDKIEAQLLARQYEGFVSSKRKKSGAGV